MIAPLISIHGQKIIVAWIIPRFTPCVHGCQPPSLPAKAAQALGERLFVKHRISRYACPSLPLSGPHENTHTILTRSFPVRMGGRHRSRNYAHPYTPWRFIYICVYTHRYIENAPCCMQRRVRKHAARVIPFSLPPFYSNVNRDTRWYSIFRATLFGIHRPPWSKGGLKSIREN